jgi:hypothetical protein
VDAMRAQYASRNDVTKERHMHEHDHHDVVDEPAHGTRWYGGYGGIGLGGVLALVLLIVLLVILF